VAYSVDFKFYFHFYVMLAPDSAIFFHFYVMLAPDSAIFCFRI